MEFHSMPGEEVGGDSGNMENIKVIVESLNGPPHNLNLTLTEFHSKAPVELLQIVSDVFATLDPKHKKDLRDENQDQMATRMIEFLMILGYSKAKNINIMDPEFREPFLAGDSHVTFVCHTHTKNGGKILRKREKIHPLLSWMLQNKESLGKRAYLARFLRNVEVPEENFADPQVVSLYQKHKELQEEFKTHHRIVDRARRSAVDPAEMKRELQQLTLEQSQLKAKLKALHNKVEHDSEYQDVNFKKILSQTHALREEQEEEHKLMEQLEDQKRDLIRNQQRRHKTNLKLQQQAANVTNPRDVAEQSKKVELLPKQIKNQENKLRELKEILSGRPMTLEEVNQLENEIGDLQTHVRTITEERNRTLEKQSAKLGFYRDQANAREAKKEKLAEAYEDLKEEKQELEAELRQLNQEMALHSTGDNRPKTEAEMQKYMLDLQAKSRQYKSLAEKLQVMKKELVTLNRTYEILRSKHPDVGSFDEVVKARKGIQETKSKLESVSSTKAGFDVEKEKTLAQVSNLVEKIQGKLSEKKGTMGPVIQKLREARRAQAEIQKEYDAKKSLHNNTYASLRSERIQLEQEVEEARRLLNEQEKIYHTFHAGAVITEARFQLVDEEKAYMSGEMKFEKDGCRNLQEYIHKSIKTLEKKAKALRVEQKFIKKHHKGKLEQRALFENLQEIMSLKLKLTVEAKQKQEKEESEGNNFMQIAGGELGSSDIGTGERLIINN
ncbi:hypothetical protein AAMO2058_001361300 [Amorphochlora amoebiformis]